MSKWAKDKIGNLSDSFAGGTPSRSRPDYFNGEIPWISSSEVNLPYIDNTKEKITVLGLENSSAKWIPKNSVLIAMYGATAGVVSKLLINATSNQAVLALVPDKEKIDGGFLYYQVKENKEAILFLAQGSGQPNLSKDLIDNFEIYFPISIFVQRQIATILSTADAVIEKTQAAIAKYKAIKQGMLQDLFTRGIDTTTGKLRLSYQDAPALYKESKLGWIPQEWEVERLGEVCSMKSGEGITSKSIYEMSDFPVYGGNGLRGFTNSYTHDGEYTLVGRQGALCGNITRVSGKFYASEHAVVVTVEKEINIDWISQKLNTMNLNQYSEASAQPGLSVNKILRLPILKPTFGEQKEIAKRLIAIDNKLHTEQDFLHKQQQIKAGLMNDLLSGRKKVSEPLIEAD
jgi:type I restriction enzyme S subunit